MEKVSRQYHVVLVVLNKKIRGTVLTLDACSGLHTQVNVTYRPHPNPWHCRPLRDPRHSHLLQQSKPLVPI
jgi:hypothetical protein